MTDLKPATSYDTRFDLTRVVNFDVNATYIIPLESGTGHYTTALARFTKDSGWEYYHPSYDRWLPIPDRVEIFMD